LAPSQEVLLDLARRAGGSKQCHGEGGDDDTAASTLPGASTQIVSSCPGPSEWESGWETASGRMLQFESSLRVTVGVCCKQFHRLLNIFFTSVKMRGIA